MLCIRLSSKGTYLKSFWYSLDSHFSKGVSNDTVCSSSRACQGTSKSFLFVDVDVNLKVPFLNRLGTGQNQYQEKSWIPFLTPKLNVKRPCHLLLYLNSL